MDETQKRLLILFTFSSVGAQISKDQIAPILLNNTDLTWFELQLTINNLITDGLLSVNEKTNKLALTINGNQIVKVYAKDIAEDLRHNINEYIHKYKNQLLREYSALSEFTKQADGYKVELKIHENSLDLLNLSLFCPTRDLAESICESFQKDPTKIYRMLFEILS